MDSKPWHPPSRRQEIDTRLGTIRVRLRELRERHPDPDRDPAAISERLNAAQRHAAEAYAAVTQVLACSAEAFRKAAQAHERVASVHDRTATKGTGDVLGHKRQASYHRAAAAMDWRRAKQAQSLLFDSERAGLAAVPDEPGDGVAP